MLVNFDFDGVIADSADSVLELTRRAQSEIGGGRAPTRDDLRTLENLTFPDLAEAIEVDPALFTERVFELQNDTTESPDLFPAMPDLLRSLAHAHSVVIITSSVESQVREILRQNNLEDTVSSICDGKMPGSKSDKIINMLEQFSIARDEAYMIGDARSDIREGKRAGVKTIAVTWGYQSRENLMLESPDFIIDSPQELCALFNIK